MGNNSSSWNRGSSNLCKQWIQTSRCSLDDWVELICIWHRWINNFTIWIILNFPIRCILFYFLTLAFLKLNSYHIVFVHWIKVLQTCWRIHDCVCALCSVRQQRVCNLNEWVAILFAVKQSCCMFIKAKLFMKA